MNHFGENYKIMFIQTDKGFIKSMRIFIDFDSTIIDNNGEVHRECIDTIRALFEIGHEIYLYSCRSNPDLVLHPEEDTNEMIEFCESHSIPYTGIIENKPFFDMLIDDRAFGVPLTAKKCVDWSVIKDKLLK